MLKVKFYIAILLFILGTSVAGATGRQAFPVYRRSYYSEMKEELIKNDYRIMLNAIGGYQNDPSDENAFQLCIGSYICGNAAVREVMEEELNGIGNVNVIDVARAVLAGRYGW
jgi:hypothetical protein